MQSSGRKSIVLGGGGIAGIAWEIGYLAGLEVQGLDVSQADLLVGTSAGATVAAQLTSGRSLHELWQRQIQPASSPAPESRAEADLGELARMLKQLSLPDTDRCALRRRFGALAAAAKTGLLPGERRQRMADRLLSHAWPNTELALVAVDVDSGQERVFNRDSAVPLVDAVAASAALPGTFPPALIGEHRYMDGCMRSMENADLALGCEHVLVLQAMRLPGVETLKEQVCLLEAQGAQVYVAQPDGASRAAIGGNPLEPKVCAATARAAYVQGRREARVARKVWC
jgi:NTE family protein